MNASKFRTVLMGVPGWAVVGMTEVWLAPFCVRDLMQHPLVAYWDSHLLYAILFGTAILTMLALNSLHLVTAFWNKPGVWVRVVSICGGYAFTMFVSLILILSLDSARVLHYYGGDAGGSAGLLIVPSVVFYSVFGVVIGGIAAVVRRFRASGPTSRMQRTPR